MTYSVSILPGTPISDHPSLKPQSLMRQLVYAVLPLGEGIVLDPFMGSGSTLAAAEAMGLCAVGLERYVDYFQASQQVIPALATLEVPLERWDTEATKKLSPSVSLQMPMKLAVE